MALNGIRKAESVDAGKAMSRSSNSTISKPALKNGKKRSPIIRGLKQLARFFKAPFSYLDGAKTERQDIFEPRHQKGDGGRIRWRTVNWKPESKEMMKLCECEPSNPKVEDPHELEPETGNQQPFETKGLRKRGGTQVGPPLQHVDSGVCGLRHEGVGEAVTEVPGWVFLANGETPPISPLSIPHDNYRDGYFEPIHRGLEQQLSKLEQMTSAAV